MSNEKWRPDWRSTLSPPIPQPSSRDSDVPASWSWLTVLRMVWGARTWERETDMSRFLVKWFLEMESWTSIRRGRVGREGEWEKEHFSHSPSRPLSPSSCYTTVAVVPPRLLTTHFSV